MYRDQQICELAAFTKHIQIAETLYVVHLEQYEALMADWQADTRHACAMSWIQLWEQIAQARALVLARGRDVSPLDAARRRGNPDALDLHISVGNRDAALLAFAEIRRCMPEVVVPSEIRRPSPPRARFAMPASAYGPIGMLAALLVVACTRGC